MWKIFIVNTSELIRLHESHDTHKKLLINQDRKICSENLYILYVLCLHNWKAFILSIVYLG